MPVYRVAIDQRKSFDFFYGAVLPNLLFGIFYNKTIHESIDFAYTTDTFAVYASIFGLVISLKMLLLIRKLTILENKI